MWVLDNHIQDLRSSPADTGVDGSMTSIQRLLALGSFDNLRRAVVILMGLDRRHGEGTRSHLDAVVVCTDLEGPWLSLEIVGVGLDSA